MADIKISQMTAGTPDENTLFEGALDGGGGVYSTRSVSASALATLLNTTIQYGGLTTSDDTIVGAINEIAQGGGGASVIQLTMAQYTALPSADKNNGSIYKITDKALIYCLDEEYHAMLEITSADYALLTSDEKNNGTLYIITDEETTAADIPYAAGVSVADKLDSLTASVNTVNSYTASYDGTKINQGNIYAYSIGKILMITGYMKTSLGDIAPNTQVATVSGVTLTQELFASLVGENGGTLRVIANTNGTIKIEKRMTNNEWFSFTMIGFLA